MQLIWPEILNLANQVRKVFHGEAIQLLIQLHIYSLSLEFLSLFESLFFFVGNRKW